MSFVDARSLMLPYGGMEGVTQALTGAIDRYGRNTLAAEDRRAELAAHEQQGSAQDLAWQRKLALAGFRPDMDLFELAEAVAAQRGGGLPGAAKPMDPTKAKREAEAVATRMGVLPDAMAMDGARTAATKEGLRNQLMQLFQRGEPLPPGSEQEALDPIARTLATTAASGELEELPWHEMMRRAAAEAREPGAAGRWREPEMDEGEFLEGPGGAAVPGAAPAPGLLRRAAGAYVGEPVAAAGAAAGGAVARAATQEVGGAPAALYASPAALLARQLLERRQPEEAPFAPEVAQRQAGAAPMGDDEAALVAQAQARGVLSAQDLAKLQAAQRSPALYAQMLERIRAAVGGVERGPAQQALPQPAGDDPVMQALGAYVQGMR
jgi:hypothetical protein